MQRRGTVAISVLRVLLTGHLLNRMQAHATDAFTRHTLASLAIEYPHVLMGASREKAFG